MITLSLIVLAAGLLAGPALARCDEMRRKPDGSPCRAENTFGRGFILCVGNLPPND